VNSPFHFYQGAGIQVSEVRSPFPHGVKTVLLNQCLAVDRSPNHFETQLK
jgi:hypothetical protein